MDNSVMPDKAQLISVAQGKAYKLLESFCLYIEKNYNPKEQIDYSKCSGAPGWNLKYKSRGKTICTIYPYDDYFIALITLNFDALEKYNIVKAEFSIPLQEKIADIKTFNGSKWVMHEIRCENDLAEAIKLISLKY